MAESSFNSVVDSLLHGMDGFLSTKTVVGEPTKIGDTIIIPLVDVSFGVGAGTFRGEKTDEKDYEKKIIKCIVSIITTNVSCWMW